MPSTVTYEFEKNEIAPDKTSIELIQEMAQWIHPSMLLVKNRWSDDAPNEVELSVEATSYELDVKIGCSWNGIGLQEWKRIRVEGYDVEAVVRIAYFEFRSWAVSCPDGEFYPRRDPQGEIYISLDKENIMGYRSASQR